MKETVTIEIAGSTYRLVSDAGAQHLRHLAQIINSRIDALGLKTSRTTSPAQKLALVALSLVDDLESARNVCLELRRDAREVALDAIQRIDRRLEADEAEAASS